MGDQMRYVLRLAEVRNTDVNIVGGKNASLGEMMQQLQSTGVRVPDGFATTAEAYWAFLDANGLRDRIQNILANRGEGTHALAEAGKAVRETILSASFPEALTQAIREAYRTLCQHAGVSELDVAVRSSATAEDLPDASFAGQQESFLNIRGETELLDACRRCYASLFTDRAIVYRETKGFDHMRVALSVGVQRMVRSDLAGSGVMFSIDTETGFPHAVLIDASWGLGEAVVQGMVDPDEYMVFKPLLEEAGRVPIIEKKLGAKEQKIIYGDRATQTVTTERDERQRFVLTDTEICDLARWACAIEKHYGRPMDMEWAKDGETGDLFIVQARPETVSARRDTSELKSYVLKNKGQILITGLSIGSAIATGPVCKLRTPNEIERFKPGSVLVTSSTDPDWVPIMKQAAAIVTDHGGRTSHAAIVSRELGLPAIVGTGHAMESLDEGQDITVSCAEGDTGIVYDGIADYEVRELALESLPTTRTRIMLNLANPSAAMRWWRLPADGVGLARMEFIVGTLIKAHPMALAYFDRLTDLEARQTIETMTAGYPDKAQYFVDLLAQGIGRIAAAFHPNPIIVRMSDFKTNEYANLIGGQAFEPDEANPMIGWRGASRYYSPEYRDGFALECAAIRKVRTEIGLNNVVMMIPFCRTLEEADKTLAVMAEEGLVRGEDGLEVYVMCEVPSNVILVDQFAERFDGFSIGSNDLTQLTLGVDRDSDRLASLFDESDPAVLHSIRTVIAGAHRSDRKVGLCGQAPSDRPAFAKLLVEAGIDSISVTPDSFLTVKENVAEAEAAQ